ncbi:MAG: hypothetical protein J0I99_07130 [Devosia sp.]|uniref:phage tail tip lysozyme n=1 Tax=Devosia sp. TaxID=1871048 RepID=UPI001AC2C9F4|nr:phage tail tip lysozyme [Devosia sp.]MBN9315490.1 hypothetical protein [Devosia sp.]
MAVLKSTRTLRKEPNGDGIMTVPAGTRVGLGVQKGIWIEVTLVDDPNQPKGWVSVEAVDQTSDTLGPLDKQVFALECHFQASVYGISGHYLAAVAALRTDIADRQGGAAIGPYAFSEKEWALNSRQPQFQLDAPAAAITSWRLQVAVFAIMTRLAQLRLAGLLGTQPQASELYLSQLIGSKAAAAALQDPKAVMASIPIDAAAAAGDGIDVANTTDRDAGLLGAGTVEAVLAAIGTALGKALDSVREFAIKAGDQPIVAAGAGLLPDGTVIKGINFESPEIPEMRRDVARLVALRFAEAGYGTIQQIAAIANAIAESGLKADAKSPEPEKSYGLFQLNLNGVGHGHDPAELKDPNRNIAIMLAHIATLSANAAFKATASVHDAVAIFVRDFERPADAAGAIIRRSAIAQTLLV